jgi:hypothetical protein
LVSTPLSYNGHLGPVEEEVGEIRESLEDTSDRTTRCGAGFEDSHVLDSHMSEAHHPSTKFA